MHLLNTRTKKLKTFYGENIPQYAILSHMWGKEEDEVLFRHIAGSDAEKSEGKMRKGYSKIKGACKQAMEDGWKYIWIDTCCIDKTSSAELSEAINSMYEWYWKSGVCYVYLEDVRSDRELDGDGEDDSDQEFDSGLDENDSDEDDDDGESESDEEEEDSDENEESQFVPFERSRWFKRGWTLQELIAPRSVVFYSKGWIDIGTKASLRDTISAVTRIRVEMLMNYDPEKASVAERMSWAAFRKTTRAEDVAYCLMGLLGVNMPLLYGEGNRAFRRLQEELMKVSDDDSLFAWKGYFSISNPGYPCGMLAVSPWDFRDGMNIVRSRDGAYSPYSMTNKGLKIELPLLPIDPNLKRNLIDIDSESIFKTILKCTVRDSAPTRWIVIYLEKIREGYYQRIFKHWFDETETPSRTEPISLLIPQASTTLDSDRQKIGRIGVKILPTESGFTIDGHSLVEGYKCSVDFFSNQKVILFKHQEKCFGVAIGLDWNMDLPWLDFIDVIDEKQLYRYDYIYKNHIYNYPPQASRVHLRERYLDRLSEKIPGEDWWVTVSVKMMGSDSKFNNGSLAVIDIQRDPIRAKGWYNPTAISISDTFSGDFLRDCDDVHPDFKKESHDWITMSNPKVKRKLDVSLVYTLLPKSQVYCVQFSHDGRYLAAGGDGDMVRVHDMETGAEIYTFVNESTGTDTHISSICFSPDSKFIATGDSNGCIKIWDIDAKCVHKVLNSHQKKVESLCFSQILPSGYLLISGSEGKIVRIWEIANGASSVLTMLPDSDYNLNPSNLSIAISPNGNIIAAGGSGGVIQIWDVVSTQLLEEFPKRGKCVQVAFTPDGTGLVSGSSDRALEYWDVGGLIHTGVERKFDDLSNLGASSMLTGGDVGRRRQPTMTFTGPHAKNSCTITSVGVSHDGRWVGISGGSRLVFWDLNDATLQLVLQTTVSDPLFATSPAGNIFATINDTESRIIRVWRYHNIEPQGNPGSHVST